MAIELLVLDSDGGCCLNQQERAVAGTGKNAVWQCAVWVGVGVLVVSAVGPMYFDYWRQRSDKLMSLYKN